MHKFLASAPDAFTRLHRAYFFSVVDSDFHHAEYWSAQVSEAEGLFLASLSERVSPDIKRQLLCNAMTGAYQSANKCRRYRVQGFPDD